MKVRFGYTRDRKSVLGRRISAITGGLYTHAVIIFYEGDSPVYFESSWSTNGNEKKNGVRGPYSIKKIEKWEAADQDSRLFITQPQFGYLPLTEAEALYAYNLACESVHTIKYSKIQLFKNWLAQRFYIHIHFGKGTPKRWTCSEFCLRLMPSRVWTYYEMLNLTADDVVPSGTKSMSLHAGTGRWITDKGTIE